MGILDKLILFTAGVLGGVAVKYHVDKKAVKEAHEMAEGALKTANQTMKAAEKMMHEATEMANANDPLKRIVREADRVTKMG